jgi:hypothetical protein
MSAGKIIAKRRNEPEFALHEDGTKVYGPETSTRIYMTPSGEWGYHWRSRDQVAHRRRFTKGILGALDKNGNPSQLVGALMQLPPPASDLRRDQLTVLSHLNRILHADSAAARILIDKFSSALKAARVLNGIDEKQSRSKEFLEHVLELCRGYGYPPTKGALAEQFYNFDSSKVSKQAKATGLSWLPDNSRPGRRGGN